MGSATSKMGLATTEMGSAPTEMGLAPTTSLRPPSWGPRGAPGGPRGPYGALGPMGPWAPWARCAAGMREAQFTLVGSSLAPTRFDGLQHQVLQNLKPRSRFRFPKAKTAQSRSAAERVGRYRGLQGPRAP